MARPLRVSGRSAPSEARPSNLRLVLQRILTEGPVSRADIARGTELNPTTVSSLVKELLDDGMIEEVGYATSTGGKPATQLAIRRSARCIIAVDLSSTPASVSRLDLSGGIVRRVVSPAMNLRGEAAVRAGIEMAEELVEESPAPIIGIGIVSPGVVLPSGEVAQSVHRDWRGVPVGRLFTEQFDLPTYVLNDSQAAALVEYGSMEGQTENLVVVVVDEGVGAGLILDNKLYVGDRSGAGELGHVRSPYAGNNRCKCGGVGCLETFAALPAIVRAVQADGYDVPDGLAGWSAVAAAADEGVPQALRAIKAAADALAWELVEVVKLLDVHKVVIVGDVYLAGDHFLGPLSEELTAHEGWPAMSNVQISYGSPKQELLLRGAAALVLNAELGVLWA